MHSTAAASCVCSGLCHVEKDSFTKVFTTSFLQLILGTNAGEVSMRSTFGNRDVAEEPPGKGLRRVEQRLTLPAWQKRSFFRAFLFLTCCFSILFYSESSRSQQFQQPKPQRIASLNLCTDQVLLQLVERERIVTLSHLATNVEYSNSVKDAEGILPNQGLAEEVAPLDPDLVLATPYSAGNATLLLKRFNYPMTLLDLPNSFAATEQFVRDIAQAVGENPAGEKIVQQMLAELESAKSTAAGSEELTAIIYGPNGHTAGGNTFKNELIKLAGFRNLAEEIGIDGYGNVSIEQLLGLDPDVIIIDDSTANQQSMAQRFTQHPVLQKVTRRARMVHVPSNLWLCAGPWSTEVFSLLEEAR
jgi:iron complex transport system substrate-binding protein